MWYEVRRIWNDVHILAALACWLLGMSFIDLFEKGTVLHLIGTALTFGAAALLLGHALGAARREK